MRKFLAQISFGTHKVRSTSNVLFSGMRNPKLYGENPKSFCIICLSKIFAL